MLLSSILLLVVNIVQIGKISNVELFKFLDQLMIPVFSIIMFTSFIAYSTIVVYSKVIGEEISRARMRFLEE